MNSKKINIIRLISLFIFALNAIVLIGDTLFEIPFPDAVIRVSGVLSLIALFTISYTTVKKHVK